MNVVCFNVIIKFLFISHFLKVV